MYHSTQVAHDDWHSLWKEAFAWSQALFADWEKRVAEQTVLSDIETSFWSMSSCQLEESCSQIENVCSRTLVCTCRISSRRGCVRPAAMRQRHRNSTTLKLCHGILAQDTGQGDKSTWNKSESVVETEHALNRNNSGIPKSNDMTSIVCRCWMNTIIVSQPELRAISSIAAVTLLRYI
jgi:hypothetical protein